MSNSFKPTGLLLRENLTVNRYKQIKSIFLQKMLDSHYARYSHNAHNLVQKLNKMNVNSKEYFFAKKIAQNIEQINIASAKSEHHTIWESEYFCHFQSSDLLTLNMGNDEVLKITSKNTEKNFYSYTYPRFSVDHHHHSKGIFNEITGNIYINSNTALINLTFLSNLFEKPNWIKNSTYVHEKDHYKHNSYINHTNVHFLSSLLNSHELSYLNLFALEASAYCAGGLLNPIVLSENLYSSEFSFPNNFYYELFSTMKKYFDKRKINVKYSSIFDLNIEQVPYSYKRYVRGAYEIEQNLNILQDIRDNFGYAPFIQKINQLSMYSKLNSLADDFSKLSLASILEYFPTNMQDMAASIFLSSRTTLHRLLELFYYIKKQ